jgi:hypothetical protein
VRGRETSRLCARVGKLARGILSGAWLLLGCVKKWEEMVVSGDEREADASLVARRCCRWRLLSGATSLI